MKRISILTDFYNLDPSYSISRCVCNQIKMLARNGYYVNLIVRDSFDSMMKARVLGANVIAVNPGEIGSNTVKVTSNSESEIQSLTASLDDVLDNVVITHDLIFQANQWKYHVACHRLKKPRRFFHFVHSNGQGSFRGKGKYRKELSQHIPNSKLVVFHEQEREQKSATFGYDRKDVLVIPNAIDFLADMHEVTKKIALDFELMQADIVAVYPARLDRGKQAHKIIEVFSHLVKDYDARIVFIDFASSGGDKAVYREQMKIQARELNVPVFFTSDLPGKFDDKTPYSYCVPHQVVLELFEIGDILVHPSKSESDPLILQEAIWKKCGLILNQDLSLFRLYGGNADFSDCETVAQSIIEKMDNPVLRLHRKARQERSIEVVSKILIRELEI